MGRTISLRGAAAGAFVEALMGKPAVTDEEHARRIAVFIHAEMKSGHDARAIQLVLDVASEGLKKISDDLVPPRMRPAGTPPVPAPVTDKEPQAGAPRPVHPAHGIYVAITGLERGVLDAIRDDESPVSVLVKSRRYDARSVAAAVNRVIKKGLVHRYPGGKLELTDAGRKRVR